MSVTSRRDLAVVLAGAGDGARMGGRGPKLLLPIAGKTLSSASRRSFWRIPPWGS
jgi:CTP:molybdopterin cytidylyltransferase MocA